MGKKKKEEDAFKSVETISRELDNINNFVLRHWKTYVYIAVIAVIIIGFLLYWYEKSERSSIRESSSFLAAKTPGEIKKSIEQYPESALADFARLRLAAKYFKDGQYGKAQFLYNQEIKNAKLQYPMFVAKLNKAYALEAEGEKSKAAQELAELGANSKTPDDIKSEANYSAGRIFFNLGNIDKAKKYLKICYNEGDQKNSSVAWPRLANGLLERIK